MSTIQDIPVEILSAIFKNLNNPLDVDQCQRVCRSWYRPARILCLERINVTSIRQFVETIDYNPEPTYLNSVKFLRISNLNDSQPLDMVSVNKVFCRFPNLTRVVVYEDLNIFAEFDDQICKTILSCCPNLSISINTSEDNTLYANTVPKLRLMLTSIVMDKINTTSPLQFVADYPKLEEITGDNNVPHSVEQWLPFVETIPNLKQMCITEFDGGRGNFLSTYLSTKTKEEQDIIVERLSKISHLDIYCDILCINPMAFLVKYLTGLEYMNWELVDATNWTDQQWRAFVDVLRWACTTEEANVAFDNMELRCLSRYMSLVVDIVYRKYKQANILRVETTNYTEEERINMSMLYIHGPANVSNISLLGTETSIATLLNSAVNSVDFNSFVLNIMNMPDINVYTRILKRLPPSTNKVILKILGPFAENEQIEDCGSRYEKVQYLELQVSSHLKFQPIINYCSSTFPSLKYMNVCGSCGVWKEKIGEFQLVLADCSLEELELDVLPVIKKMKYGQKQSLSENDFFVIELNQIQDSERNLFKVTHKLSPAKIIHDNHLRGLNRCKDYLRVNIIIGHLKSLSVYEYQYQGTTLNIF